MRRELMEASTRLHLAEARIMEKDLQVSKLEDDLNQMRQAAAEETAR